MSIYSILENTIRKSKQSINETLSNKSAFPYYNSVEISNFESGEELPLAPAASTWIHSQDNEKNFIRKNYSVRTKRSLLYFIAEILKKSNEVDYNPKILIENNEVYIELYTPQLNDVSQIDIDMSKYIDELYEDILYIEKS